MGLVLTKGKPWTYLPSASEDWQQNKSNLSRVQVSRWSVPRAKVSLHSFHRGPVPVGELLAGGHSRAQTVIPVFLPQQLQTIGPSITVNYKTPVYTASRPLMCANTDTEVWTAAEEAASRQLWTYECIFQHMCVWNAPVCQALDSAGIALLSLPEARWGPQEPFSAGQVDQINKTHI